MSAYNFACLDEQTKRMIRRAILKGLAVPAYQVPIPKFDNPKLSGNPAIQLFGAGRQKRLYALPPWCEVVSLDFEDRPFEASKPDQACGLGGTSDSYLDEVIVDDVGGRMFVCSDTDHCEDRQAQGHRGKDAA